MASQNSKKLTISDEDSPLMKTRANQYSAVQVKDVDSVSSHELNITGGLKNI